MLTCKCVLVANDELVGSLADGSSLGLENVDEEGRVGDRTVKRVDVDAVRTDRVRTKRARVVGAVAAVAALLLKLEVDTDGLRTLFLFFFVSPRIHHLRHLKRKQQPQIECFFYGTKATRAGHSVNHFLEMQIGERVLALVDERLELVE